MWSTMVLAIVLIWTFVFFDSDGAMILSAISVVFSFLALLREEVRNQQLLEQNRKLHKQTLEANLYREDIHQSNILASNKDWKIGTVRIQLEDTARHYWVRRFFVDTWDNTYQQVDYAYKKHWWTRKPLPTKLICIDDLKQSWYTLIFDE